MKKQSNTSIKKLNSINKTLYIPLYGKAYVSKKGLFLKDEKAEQIWETEGFSLKAKSKSKWLAYYMGIRSALFDEWTKEKIEEMASAIIVQIGCGLDSRVQRINYNGHIWCDVDFLDVINERKKYYKESTTYKMIASDATELDWLNELPTGTQAIVIMEGVSMYLSNDSLQRLIKALSLKFDKLCLLMDCYSELAAKLSKVKNPINDVGVTKVYGLDNPAVLNTEDFIFNQQLLITPQRYIDELKGFEKKVFQKLYAGNFSKKLYKLYEFKKIKTKQNNIDL